MEKIQKNGITLEVKIDPYGLVDTSHLSKAKFNNSYGMAEVHAFMPTSTQIEPNYQLIEATRSFSNVLLRRMKPTVFATLQDSTDNAFLVGPKGEHPPCFCFPREEDYRKKLEEVWDKTDGNKNLVRQDIKNIKWVGTDVLVFKNGLMASTSDYLDNKYSGFESPAYDEKPTFRMLLDTQGKVYGMQNWNMDTEKMVWEEHVASLNE